MATNRDRTIKARLSQRSMTPLVLVSIGACLAAAMGFLLVGTGGKAALVLVSALSVVVLAFWSPYWALVVTTAQFAFIPCESGLLGVFVPNVLQLLAPVALVAALLQALKNADDDRLAPRPADLFVGGLGLWGLVGMYFSGTAVWKWYANRMLLPQVLYYATRFVSVDRKQVRRLVFILLGAIALQALLMIRESMAGSSPLYDIRAGVVEGIKPAKGPFPFYWNAGTYLCLWPALFVYALAESRQWKGKLLWAGGLAAVMAATARTMQRAPLAAGLLGIAVCVLSPKLRRTALVILGIVMVLAIPWSMGRAGGALTVRFGETDQSRYAYRMAAFNLLRSPRWNPAYGIGWGNFPNIAGQFGGEEEVFMWGTRRMTVSEAAEGAHLHNVWLAIPVEFGVVGVVLALAILAALLVGLRRIRHPGEGYATDDGLLVSMVASLLAVGAIGYFQNVYAMAESMSILWVFYALLTAHPRVFWKTVPQKAVDE